MPRENTIALLADPAFSVITGTDGNKWGKITAPNARAMHELSKKYGRTRNEGIIRRQDGTKTRQHWIGLGDQTISDYDETGIAREFVETIKKSVATLPAQSFRPAEIRSAVSGGVWNVPAVLANIPLAAQTRVRTKIAPIDIRISLSFSAAITAEDLAPYVAKLASAIWGYTQRGGVVNLTVYMTCGFNGAQHHGLKGLITETRCSARDVADLALAFSPVAFRAVAIPLMQACSDYPCDSLTVRSTYLPGNIIQGAGVLGGIFDALDKAAEALKIA